MRKTFPKLLLAWDKEQNIRKMPWKGEKDPYRIWLSEIILQQTRVEQGLSYYQRFLEAFPTIHELAKAPDEKVFKLWEGLGYYSRCRNLIATARMIATERKGEFPRTYEEIKTLKGIGPYTAAAISSFAFNLPHAVVDGNVFRVLARVFGIDQPTDSTEGKKMFSALANELLDKKHPAQYNQAIMDFGAVICKPAAPLCQQCVFQEKCFAFVNEKVNELPVKAKKISVRKRWFYYFMMEYKGEIALQQRTGKDIWQQLYQFPMLESSAELKEDKVFTQAERQGLLEKGKYSVQSEPVQLKQQLSHQTIIGRFVVVKLENKPVSYLQWTWIKKHAITNFAFPRIINQFLDETGVMKNAR